MMEGILKSVELEYTILDFYENMVVSRVREGVVFRKKQVQDLVEVCSYFYENKGFVYISERVNNYNVDPTIYINLQLVENLAGIAIVCNKPSSIKMANFEQSFSKVPFSVFLEMQEAQEWVSQLFKSE